MWVFGISHHKTKFPTSFQIFSIFQIPSPNAAAQVVATPVPLGPIFLDCHVPMFPLCFVWFRHIPPKFPMVIYYVSHFDPQVLNILHMCSLVAPHFIPHHLHQTSNQVTFMTSPKGKSTLFWFSAPKFYHNFLCQSNQETNKIEFGDGSTQPTTIWIKTTYINTIGKNIGTSLPKKHFGMWLEELWEVTKRSWYGAFNVCCLCMLG